MRKFPPPLVLAPPPMLGRSIDDLSSRMSRLSSPSSGSADLNKTIDSTIADLDPQRSFRSRVSLMSRPATNLGMPVLGSPELTPAPKIDNGHGFHSTARKAALCFP